MPDDGRPDGLEVRDDEPRGLGAVAPKVAETGAGAGAEVDGAAGGGGAAPELGAAGSSGAGAAFSGAAAGAASSAPTVGVAVGVGGDGGDDVAAAMIDARELGPTGLSALPPWVPSRD